MTTTTRCPECGTPDPVPMRCIACDATETQTNMKTYPVRLIDGRPMCYACYYTGTGYSMVHADLIAECQRLGVDMSVWQTGGGCQNFGVVIDPNYPDECGTEVLLGEALDDITETFLGVCIHYGDDYADEWSDEYNATHTPPHPRTVENVAEWMATIVTDLRRRIAFLKVQDATS